MEIMKEMKEEKKYEGSHRSVGVARALPGLVLQVNYRRREGRREERREIDSVRLKKGEGK